MEERETGIDLVHLNVVPVFKGCRESGNLTVTKTGVDEATTFVHQIVRKPIRECPSGQILSKAPPFKVRKFFYKSSHQNIYYCKNNSVSF